MARESDSVARGQWAVEPTAYSSEDLGVGCAEHGNEVQIYEGLT